MRTRTSDKIVYTFENRDLIQLLKEVVEFLETHPTIKFITSMAILRNDRTWQEAEPHSNPIYQFIIRETISTTDGKLNDFYSAPESSD